MHRILLAPIALWALFRLGLRTRFNLRAPYWRWRYETAFGADPARMPGRMARLGAIIDYGCWLHRMRRLISRR